MKEYHKIHTIYKRNQKNMRELFEGDWSKPEFEILKDIEWTWTEKIDGTNIRIYWDGEKVILGGRTDNASIPAPLVEILHQTFTPEKMKATFDSNDVCLYGEGYGKKIQHGHNYISDAVSFILFDIRVGVFWLQRDSLEGISQNLEIKIVPILGKGTLQESVEFVRKGFKSTIAENKEYEAEGLILKLPIDMLERNGQRIITKIKCKDFKPVI